MSRSDISHAIPCPPLRIRQSTDQGRHRHSSRSTNPRLHLRPASQHTGTDARRPFLALAVIIRRGPVTGFFFLPRRSSRALSCSPRPGCNSGKISPRAQVRVDGVTRQGRSRLCASQVPHGRMKTGKHVWRKLQSFAKNLFIVWPPTWETRWPPSSLTRQRRGWQRFADPGARRSSRQRRATAV